MKLFFGWLARIFNALGKICEGFAKPAHPLPSTLDKAARLKELLAKPSLADDERKELAGLVMQFEGEVIFLDSPTSSAKEEL